MEWCSRSLHGIWLTSVELVRLQVELAWLTVQGLGCFRRMGEAASSSESDSLVKDMSHLAGDE